ncbi:MAG: bifunctional homocysteine S-methyltransferase/methylenetetrahydrofolate reductase [bacterium]|nr:bifunctional homocysteine S-methyltransferase/methylenetetrahydrofolate reductase [bacterium]
MSNPFLSRLKQGAILGDGAMGTYLYTKGVSFNHCFDHLNLTDPQLIGAIHEEYINAGSDLIETNTYGANRLKLAQHGLEDLVREINYRGVKIARDRREISGKDILVAGSIGPLGKLIGRFGGLTPAEARSLFSEQATALLEGGVDLFMVETIPDVEELRLAVEEIRKICDLPISGQVSINDDLRTIRGSSPLEVLEAARELKLDILGANCSVGPQRIYDFVALLHGMTDMPLSALPNAGLPKYNEGRFFYVSSPEYFAEYCGKFLNLGVSIVGGCCGTTPDHIRAMRRVIGSFQRVSPTNQSVEVGEEARDRTVITSDARVSDFAAKLGKKFVVSVEIDPPRGANAEKVLKAAAKLKEVGVDAVNIADSPMARTRMSCLAVSGLISAQTKIDVILHFTCRDRNLMGLQSDLIGAHALGVRNILALTGDPPSLGDYPNATAVYDVDAIGLVDIIARLNNGADLAGNPIGSNTEFSIGVAINPTLETLTQELERLERKIAAGAQFAMTQPLYELDVLEQFLERTRNFQIPILLGLLPLQSYRHAEFLHNEVPGIEIPADLRRAMNDAGKDAAQVGIESCRDLLQRAKGMVQGANLMPSFGRFETVLKVLE